MQIRKLLLASMALVLLAGAPVMAEEGAAAPEGHEGHGKMDRPDADTDGDGFLSKAEFMAVQEKRFGEMDGNSDGKVSKEEMKAHFQSMKEKFKERREEMKKEHGEGKPAQ